MTAPRLTFAPRPYSDEAVSSWLERIAARYGARSGDLARYLQLKIVDPDQELAEDDLAILAGATNIEIGRLRDWNRGARTDDLEPHDLLALDIETAQRGTVCPRCLDEDSQEGRDHYIRRRWITVWRVSCPTHGCQLRDFEAIHLDVEYRLAKRRVRFSSLFEEALRPLRGRRLHPLRVVGKNLPPAHLVAMESFLADGRAITAADAHVWTGPATPKDIRKVARDVARLLLSRSRFGPFVLHCFQHPDDIRLAPGSLITPGPEALPALQIDRRVAVLAAVAAVVIRPDRFQLSALQGQGRKHFFEAHGILAKSLNAAPTLARLAQQDPLSLILSIASTKEAERLAKCAVHWPKAMRARFGRAAPVALALAGL